MKLNGTTVCFVVLGFLLGPSIGGAAPGRQADDAFHDDVVLSGRDVPATTADEDQQRLILRLARGERRDEGLAGLTVDYPIERSVFPPDIVTPTFLWHDEVAGADRWLVEVGAGEDRFHVLVPGVPPPQGEIDPMAISSTNEVYVPTPYQASANSWRPAPRVWQVMKTLSRERPISVTFLGYRHDAPDAAVSVGRVTLSTSKDPVGAPIFYRDVPLIPPPKKENAIMPLRKGALPLIKWRLRDVSLPASRVMFTDMPTCANCHSFSADGRTMGMDIDGPKGDKGAYAISPIEREMTIDNEDVISWNSFDRKPPGHKTLGFMSRMSPDGRYAVTTLNEQTYVANFQDYKFGQVFYPTRGIIAYYSRETGEMESLPGADDPEYVHVGPVWTPDGKSVVFARARARDPFPPGRPPARYAGDPNETPIQYDLYRIPFNEGRGGRAQPIVGASGNGMSNNFAKISPDGKWIVFVQCKNGLLMRPDSRLWIVPIEGGEARQMNCNTSLMNSWHSFSPNGRWLVFSSKSNTPYTQMFLTHLDEEGNDTPAVLIENSTAANRAVNIPEFVNRSYEDFAEIYVGAVEHYRHYDRARELSVEGRFEEAISEYEKAIEQDPDDSRFHVGLSQVLLRLGRYEQAIEHTRQALQINPFNYQMHTNMGFLLVQTGNSKEALSHLGAATRINPRHAQGWYNRATLYLRMDNYDGALADYTEALRLRPRYPAALTGRGAVLKARGHLKDALVDFDRSIEIRPLDYMPRYFRALMRKDAGDLPGALEDLNVALENAPGDSPKLKAIQALRRDVLLSLQSSEGDG